MLSGKEIMKQIIKGKIRIDPYNIKYLNPNSYDVTLNNKLLVYKRDFLDCKEPNETREIVIPEEGFIMEPGVLYLGRTNEYTATNGFVPGIEGKSSLARLGLLVHYSAGFGDQGFKGYWTLEMTSVYRLRIYPGMRIAQLYYDELTGEETEYKGKYQGNTGVGASKSYEDFS